VLTVDKHPVMVLRRNQERNIPETPSKSEAGSRGNGGRSVQRAFAEKDRMKVIDQKFEENMKRMIWKCRSKPIDLV
jgi:hypothetical protein